MNRTDSFLTAEEINQIGFASCGECVKISRKASFYSPQTISLGDNVRIDDFCILTGNIKIGSNIHIAAYVALYGAKGIVIEDYAGISAKTIVYSAVDDFSGDFLVGPMLPKSVTNVKGGCVYLKKYSQIGAACVVMPDLSIHEGAVVGAMSFVNKDIQPWTINAGIPCKELRKRGKKLLDLLK